MTQIVTQTATLPVADGSAMNAYVARPADGTAHPGLMVFQEAFGVNAHIRDVTERCARAGVVAIAPELFHRTAPGFEAALAQPEPSSPNVRGRILRPLDQAFRLAARRFT